MFLEFEKNVKVYLQFWRSVFNTQLPKVNTSKVPTSNILLRNNVSIIAKVSKASCLQMLTINPESLFSVSL